MIATQELQAPFAASATWTIDPAHTSVEFAVKHLMISKVRGRFTGVEATLSGTPERPLEATAEAVIDAATIDTGNAERDVHLRSPDFFDVEQFPTLRYSARSMRPKGDDRFEVEGDLTIRDITRPVTLTVTLDGLVQDPWGNQRMGLSAEGKINRSDFGLTWNTALETGGVLVGDEVSISAEVQAVLQVVAQAA